MCPTKIGAYQNMGMSKKFTKILAKVALVWVLNVITKILALNWFDAKSHLLKNVRHALILVWQFWCPTNQAANLTSVIHMSGVYDIYYTHANYTYSNGFLVHHFKVYIILIITIWCVNSSLVHDTHSIRVAVSLAIKNEVHTTFNSNRNLNM
jgi:hypothetical protein